MYDHAHGRHNTDWVNPVHECLRYIGKEPEQHVWCPEVELLHYPDPAKSRSYYLPLLELAVAEKPNETRNYFYLGREYMFHNRSEKSIAMLKEYLDMASWKEERGGDALHRARLQGAGQGTGGQELVVPRHRRDARPSRAVHRNGQAFL